MPTNRPPFRHNGRRGLILRATRDDFRTLDEVATAVRSRLGAACDPSIDRIKTRHAIKDLHRAQLVAKTPYGWRCTTAGLQALDAAASSR